MDSHKRSEDHHLTQSDRQKTKRSFQSGNHFVDTVDAGYKNTGYKNMPVIRTLSRFTESFVFYSIDFFSGYKNMPDILVRTLYAIPNDVLITGIHCTIRVFVINSPPFVSYIRTQ